MNETAKPMKMMPVFDLDYTPDQFLYKAELAYRGTAKYSAATFSEKRKSFIKGNIIAGLSVFLGGTTTVIPPSWLRENDIPVLAVGNDNNQRIETNETEPDAQLYQEMISTISGGDYMATGGQDASDIYAKSGILETEDTSGRNVHLGGRVPPPDSFLGNNASMKYVAVFMEKQADPEGRVVLQDTKTFEMPIRRQDVTQNIWMKLRFWNPFLCKF
ncbi:hypothetical protein BD410DRAFT_809526 [Rickenella mellea]|uniref:Uncharacterized protein n=1 Tax=Rickenella mellea TaxID=50990 RepID=A0A4Y7PH49_9AGAM|nr:hypothetical protein BD410DRAFT_809526 [Rickenella mellea]